MDKDLDLFSYNSAKIHLEMDSLRLEMQGATTKRKKEIRRRMDELNKELVNLGNRMSEFSIPDQCGKFLGKTGAEVCEMPECDVVHELLILEKKFLHLHLFLKKRILEGEFGVVVFDDMPERSL